jgi:Transglutaminase-like superfamily
MLCTALLLNHLVAPATVYMGVYLTGQKVGYSAYTTAPTTYRQKPAQRTITLTRMKFGLIGSEVEMKIDSETITVEGKLMKMHFSQESGGRSQTVDAVFSDKEINLDVLNNGTKSKHTLQIPADGRVVDDPVTDFALGNATGEKVFYILDPATVSLVKNTVKSNGQKEVEISGSKVVATELELTDPRLTTLVYTSTKGDLLKVSTTIGLEMLPLTEAEALAANREGSNPDLASITSIVPEPAIDSPMALSRLNIRLSADNMPEVPSDSQQSAKKEGKAWIIDIHPTQLTEAKSVSIDKAKAARPDWVRPSLNIPSDSEKFKKLAKSIIGKRTDVRSAALEIRQWVNKRMRVNAGIGVLRDANEILGASEGVCRDYAILTATLCRAAGIPTRLVSGLVNFDGNFYYHAWVDVYTGFDWVPLDSVPNTARFSATHVKLSQGNVDKAFTFTVLAKAKMQVLVAK